SEGLGGVQGVPPGFNADQLLNAGQRARLDAAVLDAARDVLATSLHDIYFLILFCACIAFAVVLFFPRGKVHELAAGATQRAGAAPQRQEASAGAEPAPGGSS
ncbi:MAG TPA: hypothetical protein VIB47_13230, partial [Dehalococcoidia bacterium]